MTWIYHRSNHEDFEMIICQEKIRECNIFFLENVNLLGCFICNICEYLVPYSIEILPLVIGQFCLNILWDFVVVVLYFPFVLISCRILILCYFLLVVIVTLRSNIFQSTIYCLIYLYFDVYIYMPMVCNQFYI